MHSGAIVSVQRLRHKCRRLAERHGSVLNNIFEQHHIVRGMEQIREPKIDLALTGSSNLMMMTFDVDSDVGERQRDHVANVNKCVNRSYRNVTFLRADMKSGVRHIRAGASGIPMSL